MSLTAERFQPFGTTIFSEMTQLASEHDAINLSQGFPDFEGPEEMLEAVEGALREGRNQYHRSMGDPDLVHALAADAERRYGLQYDPMEGVTVTCGATEAISAALLGLVDPGDEVVVFEPFYDSYPAAMAMAGARPRYCTLRFPDFALDEMALAECFGPRTRAVILNTPHNPTGKVFSAEELQQIAKLCEEHDAIVIADEVYEHLTFDDAEHMSIAQIPGMAERTLRISSAGKTWSYTGWKVGWAMGPAGLVAGVQSAHQFLTFCTPAPMQRAVLRALESFSDGYLDRLRSEYQARRDFLVGALTEVGLNVAVPKGTYFALADFTARFDGDDRAFARHLTVEHGVACIPPTPFYHDHPEDGRRLARFAFCKRMRTLQQAAGRLRGLTVR